MITKDMISALGAAMLPIIREAIKEEIANNTRASGGNSAIWSGTYEAVLESCNPLHSAASDGKKAPIEMKFLLRGKSFRYLCPADEFALKFYSEISCKNLKPEIISTFGSLFDFGINFGILQNVVYAIDIKKKGSNDSAVEVVTDFEPLRIREEN